MLPFRSEGTVAAGQEDQSVSTGIRDCLGEPSLPYNDDRLTAACPEPTAI